MNNNHYNIDKKLREMENQLAPDLTQMENHWQHMKSILANPSLHKSPDKGFLNSPFRLFTLLCATGLTFFIIFQKTPTTNIQSNSNESSPSSNSVVNNQTDTVPKSKKKVMAYERKDSSIHAVHRKKVATSRKTNPVNKCNDSLELVGPSTQKSNSNDTIYLYSTTKIRVGYFIKPLPTKKDTIHLKPMKIKYTTRDMIRLIQDSINIITDVRYSKKMKKTINKNNNTSVDSTKY